MEPRFPWIAIKEFDHCSIIIFVVTIIVEIEVDFHIFTATYTLSIDSRSSLNTSEQILNRRCTNFYNSYDYIVGADLRKTKTKLIFFLFDAKSFIWNKSARSVWKKINFKNGMWKFKVFLWLILNCHSVKAWILPKWRHFSH